METKFRNQVTKALKTKRAELFVEIEHINETLKIFEPQKRAPKVTPAVDQQQAKILKALQADKWMTMDDLRKKTRMRQGTTERALAALVESDKILQRNIGGYVHYQKPTIKLVAGEGELKAS